MAVAGVPREVQCACPFSEIVQTSHGAVGLIRRRILPRFQHGQPVSRMHHCRPDLSIECRNAANLSWRGGHTSTVTLPMLSTRFLPRRRRPPRSPSRRHYLRRTRAFQPAWRSAATSSASKTVSVRMHPDSGRGRGGAKSGTHRQTAVFPASFGIVKAGFGRIPPFSERYHGPVYGPAMI